METENGPYRRPSEHNTFHMFLTTDFCEIMDPNGWSEMARKYSNIIVPYSKIESIFNEIIDRARKEVGESTFVYNHDDGKKEITIEGEGEGYSLTVFKLTATKVNKIIL